MCTSKGKINDYIKLITDRNAISGAFKGLKKDSLCTPLFSILQEGANFHICIITFVRTACCSCHKNDSMSAPLYSEHPERP